MTSKYQLIIAIALLFVLAGGAHWLKTQAEMTILPDTTYENAPQVVTPKINTNLNTSATDTSAKAIDSDTAAIDKQLGSLDNDAAGIQEGVAGAKSQQ